MDQKNDWHLTADVPHEGGRGDPFAAAVRATRMPMVVTDPAQPDNPIVFVNEAFQRLSGYSRDEIVGRNCRFLQGPDTDRDAVARVRAAIKDGEPIDVDLLNYRKDGSTFWNALSLSPVRNADGGMSYFFASQLDITGRVEREAELSRDRDRVEQEVRRRTADLEDALRAKDLLLHEVDHRVKNNLNMIGSLIRLQARALGEPRLASRLETMLERVDALASVHRQLYQRSDVTRFDIGAFAEELMLDIVGASGRDGIEVRADVESVEVSSNHAAPLGLALNEVATNAVKHGFAGGRSGTLAVEAYGREGRGFICVSDDGKGMADAGASGLGRTLVERLMRQVGGSVRWDPLAPGTAVMLSFPLLDGSEMAGLPGGAG